MQPLAQLINITTPAWPEIHLHIQDAANDVNVLPCTPARGATALYHTQIDISTPLGAVVYHTGGILVDHGWLRILGAGHEEKLDRSLPDWNKGKTFAAYGDKPGYLLIADDVLGGFFALNYGALGAAKDKVYYLSPQTLQWEMMDVTYTEFLYFCFNGDLHGFYPGYTWEAHQAELADMPGNTVYSFFPPLFLDPAIPVGERSRKIMSVEEQYDIITHIALQKGKLN
ncbi:DUF2625 family protein [Deminuibacter soli]|nr:DUF2625 family protein [Deminuibacter soli]